MATRTLPEGEAGSEPPTLDLADPGWREASAPAWLLPRDQGRIEAALGTRGCDGLGTGLGAMTTRCEDRA